MIAIPAIDLRDGACVQLVGGSYAEERIRIPDPLDAVARWTSAGFRRLHVVDLDAAMAAGMNTPLVDRLVGVANVEVQVGGGVRSSERVRDLLTRGASRVVVGTRAIEDRAWLQEITSAFPGRIVVAADVRGRSVVTHGWAAGGLREVNGFVRSLAGLPLAGLLVTAVHREGRMQGTDVHLMDEIVAASSAPVIASGGIATHDELRELAQRGVAAVVLGMALYTGTLDARAVAEEFGE
jgi:phosphoribosylformimino-5-aminoimidazole carboxamide ribotide isomerase